MSSAPLAQSHRVKRLPLVTVVALLAATVAITVGFAAGSPTASPAPTGTALARVPQASPTESIEPAPPTPPPDPTPTPTDTPLPLADVPIVPVTQFRTTAERTTSQEVAAVLAGSSKSYDALELVEADADAILAALGADRPEDPARLILAPDAATLSSDLAKNRKRLAFLRADEVGPGVRALAWGDQSLFGVGRVKSLDEWALNAQLPQDGTPASTRRRCGRSSPAATSSSTGASPRPSRSMARASTSRSTAARPRSPATPAAPAFGWEVPKTRRTSDGGAMRALISGADIAIANFENPAPDRFRYHTSGTVFSADPALIEGLANAGIDWVSLANNHIGDAGRNGILQTIDNLAELRDQVRRGRQGREVGPPADDPRGRRHQDRDHRLRLDRAGLSRRARTRRAARRSRRRT